MRTSDENWALKVPILNKMVAPVLQCSINHINLLRSLLLAVSLNQDGYRCKHRARCRCTLPITVWILATMLLQAQLMVTEDGMEFRTNHTWRVCSTLWALSETVD